MARPVTAPMIAETLAFADLASWRSEWDRLASHAAEPNVFNERWFLDNAIRHLPSPPQGEMLMVHREGILLGMLPLATVPKYGRIVARHLTNWVHYQSFLGTPLVRAGSELEFWQAVLCCCDAKPGGAAFLHLSSMSPGPVLTALTQCRSARIFANGERALLATELTSYDYAARNGRGKKRKDLRRLRARLGEIGALRIDRIDGSADPDVWIDQFLELEHSGWKGRTGSSLASDQANGMFFRTVIRAAHRACKLDMRRLVLDNRPLAMLITLLAPPGGFSFKIAYDEAFARYSPGVLLQRDALDLIDSEDLRWIDSCAAPGHPMIDSLWAERRKMVRVAVPLAGIGKRLTFTGVMAIEKSAAVLRHLL